jgi:hypothetical protein
LTTLTLNHGYEAIVDDEDYPLLSLTKWKVSFSADKKRVYACVRKRIDGKFHKILLHRVLMDCPKGLEVDHINRNTLDNRRSNLRICTSQQNSFNVKGRSKWGYKGVCFHPHISKFEAQLKVGKQKYTNGCYEKVEDAARAHDELAKKHHGEFAFLNFPEEA